MSVKSLYFLQDLFVASMLRKGAYYLGFEIPNIFSVLI